MVNPREYVETAQAILKRVEEVYADHGVELPSRRYLSVGGMGDVVHDCEQVTVSFEQGYTGSPGNQAQEPVRCDSPRTGVFLVEIVRCTPVPKSAEAPKDRYGTPSNVPKMTSTADETASAIKQMIDAMLLMEAGLSATAADFASTSTALADVTAGPNQGGFQGMILTLAAPAISMVNPADYFNNNNEFP